MERVTLEALESALAPIEAIGKSETTFDVNGTTVSLRVALPEEEIAAQRYASEALSKADENKTHDMLDYIERFKIEILSYALIRVGDMDLHGVQYVETGKTLDNGQSVKEPKPLAMRRFLSRWTQDVRTRMFIKYSELLTKVTLEAEKSIVYDPVDLDTEIERVEKRLEDLKAERNRQTNPDSISGVREQVQAVADVLKSDSKDRQKSVEEMMMKRTGVKPEEDPALPENKEPSPALGPITRNNVYSEASTPPPERLELKVPQEPVKQQSEQPPAPTWGEDSFVDPGDTDGLRAAVHAENQRLLAQRRGTMPSVASVLDMKRKQETVPPVQAPHVSAREVAEDLESEELQILKESRKALTEATGELDGSKVFRQPTEVLDRRVPQPNQPKASLNNTMKNQSVNPRFQPVKK